MTDKYIFGNYFCLFGWGLGRDAERQTGLSLFYWGVSGGVTMLATFAFDVCHDVYLAAREAIDTKIPTLNSEASGKYLWRPDRMPRLAEYVCDFARVGERALGGGGDKGQVGFRIEGQGKFEGEEQGKVKDESKVKGKQAEACSTFGPSRIVLFRVYYLGGAEYQAARRHLGISEFAWENWADEIRRVVGRELIRAGVFPPSRYFLESTAKAS